MTARRPVSPGNAGRGRLTTRQDSAGQIVQEFGRWPNASHQQIVAGAGARDVKQMPLAVVDLFELGIVNYLITTNDSSEFA